MDDKIKFKYLKSEPNYQINTKKKKRNDSVYSLWRKTNGEKSTASSYKVLKRTIHRQDGYHQQPFDNSKDSYNSKTNVTTYNKQPNNIGRSKYNHEYKDHIFVSLAREDSFLEVTDKDFVIKT